MQIDELQFFTDGGSRVILVRVRVVLLFLQ